MVEEERRKKRRRKKRKKEKKKWRKKEKKRNPTIFNNIYFPLSYCDYLSVHHYYHLLNLSLKHTETTLSQIKLKQILALDAVLLQYIPSD